MISMLSIRLADRWMATRSNSAEDSGPSSGRGRGKFWQGDPVKTTLDLRQCEPAFDLDQKQISRCVFTSARPGECRRKRFRSTNMTSLLSALPPPQVSALLNRL